MSRFLIAVVAALTFVSTAAAGSALPRLPVDKVLRAHQLAARHGATVTCSWTAATATYGCVTWRPSSTATGNVIAGKNAQVISRVGVTACAKTQPGIAGCSATTTGPSCTYARWTYNTTGTGGAARIVNVCRAGWQKLI